MPKLHSQISVESLEPLIAELTKEKPNTTRVKKLMLDHGLEYTNDPIQQMSCVLDIMSDVAPAMVMKSRRKKSPQADL